ncbi:hypothetical protein AMECASPLE_026092 [Ameca splendens]|uniref:Uncharacterized protein n=1 Tax=Ameca splendens TaxID=208324 RepID=A0ABV0Z2S8_9TELE
MAVGPNRSLLEARRNTLEKLEDVIGECRGRNITLGPKRMGGLLTEGVSLERTLLLFKNSSVLLSLKAYMTLLVKHHTLHNHQVRPAKPALNYTGVGRQVITLYGR